MAPTTATPVLALVLYAVAASASAGALPKLSVSVAKDGGMVVTLASKPWLVSAPYSLTVDSQVYSTRSGGAGVVPLVLASNTATSGHDAAGPYTGATLDWQLGHGGRASFRTSVKVYATHAIFTQVGRLHRPGPLACLHSVPPCAAA